MVSKYCTVNGARSTYTCSDRRWAFVAFPIVEAMPPISLHSSDTRDGRVEVLGLLNEHSLEYVSSAGDL